MSSKFNTTDEFLDTLSEDKRASLEKLRQTIKSIVPKAEEYFYYQLPAFRLDGKRLVAFGWAAFSIAEDWSTPITRRTCGARDEAP